MRVHRIERCRIKIAFELGVQIQALTKFHQGDVSITTHIQSVEELSQCQPALQLCGRVETVTHRTPTRLCLVNTIARL